MATKYDPRLTLATVEGLTSRISLAAHQIGTSRCKSFLVSLDSDKLKDYERRRHVEAREDAIRLMAELETDVKALRKMLALMEKNA